MNKTIDPNVSPLYHLRVIDKKGHEMPYAVEPTLGIDAATTPERAANLALSRLNPELLSKLEARCIFALYEVEGTGDITSSHLIDPKAVSSLVYQEGDFIIKGYTLTKLGNIVFKLPEEPLSTTNPDTPDFIKFTSTRNLMPEGQI